MIGALAPEIYVFRKRETSQRIDLMSNRRVLATSFLCAAVVLINNYAGAAERALFTSAAFAAAQKAGKPILVDITASWCPTCKAQQTILRQLSKERRFSDVVVFEVDFDSQREAVRSFKARSQSTLIAFRGEAEIVRSVGDTNPASIAALLDAAL